MDIKKIQELIKLINKSNIGEITIEEEGTKITLKQKPDPVQNFISSSTPVYAPPAQSAPTPAPASSAPASAPADR